MNRETIIGKCWHCGTELTNADFGRETDCRSCGKATRVCRNCRWYALEQSNQCQEPMAERVMDKTKANFCEYFEPTTTPDSGGEKSSADALRQAAEDLFKS
jgi:primosomal protein N'